MIFSHEALRILERCKSVLLHTYRIAPRVIFLICVYELYAPEKRLTRQTSLSIRFVMVVKHQN
jgi:hypothetical protein